MKLLEDIGEWFDIDTSEFSEETLISEFIRDDFELAGLIDMLSACFGAIVDDSTAESWETVGDITGFLGERS
jgi:acyl carrier protein